MSKKQLINSRQIQKILSECKMNPSTNVIDKMLIDVNNLDFYVGRAYELITYIRLQRREAALIQESVDCLIQRKEAIDIIKLLTLFCAYLDREVK